MHLHLPPSISLTGLTPSALDVEGEPARIVPAQFRFGGQRKEVANLIPDIDIRGRIRPGRPSDRVLGDIDHFIDVVQSFQMVILSGFCTGPVQFPRQEGLQRLGDQGGFSAAETPVTQVNNPRGNRAVMSLRLFCCAPARVSHFPLTGRRLAWGE